MKLNTENLFLMATLGITLSGVGVYAAQRNAEAFRLGPATTLNIPARPAGADTLLNSFDNNRLLATRLPLSIAEELNSDWTTIQADSAGVVKLPGLLRENRSANSSENLCERGSANSTAKKELRTLTTRLRPERFAKGKLTLKSNVPAELYLDGKKLTSIAKADTTLNSESADVTLEPEKLALIQINLMASSDDPQEPMVGLSFDPAPESENVQVDLSPMATRRFDIQVTTLGQFANRVTLSPDGKYIIISYKSTTDGYDSIRLNEVSETASGKVVYSTVNSIGWLPTGSTLYYTQKSTTGQGFDLFTLEPTRPIARKVTTLRDENFHWAPDASYIVYYDNVEGPKETGVMRRTLDPDDRMPGARDNAYLIKQDLKSGVTTHLTYGGPTTYLCDISPDSKKILYLSTRRTPDKFPFYEGSLVQLDVNTLRTDTIMAQEGDGGITSAVYSPDAKKIFLVSSPNAFDGIGRNAGQFEYANDFDYQGYILDLETRKADPVTRDFDPSIQGEPVWNRADGKIYFRAEEGFYSPIFCYDPQKRTFTRLNTDIEYASNFSIGEYESRWLAVAGTSLHYSGRATLVDLKTNKSRILADPHAGDMTGINLGKEESWTFTSKDGSLIDGVMVLPPDFDPAKKYPLIVYYYGGTSPSSRAMTHPYTPHLFASRDYVVYVLNPSGTPGYGQEFSARHVNAWGDWTADEIIEGTKKFCDAHPFVDRKKIGCMGASYGGFMTQYLLTKTDIFTAAISHAGISNVTSYWGEGYWGYSYNSVAAARSYPWNNPDLFTKHGSLFNADKIHTPLLLLHGSVDTNVPIGESIQLFNALKILGRQVEMITVEGQDHIITDYNKRLLWHQTIMAWFARYLQDDPNWWNSLYPDSDKK